MSKKSLLMNWADEAQTMMKEALPQAREVIENARIEFVSESRWIRERDKIARECGESENKRKLADGNIKDPDVLGEFVSGSKGCAIILKKERFAEREFFIEALIHELGHACCHETAKRNETYLSCEKAEFPSREIMLGYCMWNEFCAQAISKIICGSKEVCHKGDIRNELLNYLNQIIEQRSGEGTIGMFFADLMFDYRLNQVENTKELLCELLSGYDDEIQECFLALYNYIQQILECGDFYEIDEEKLDDLGCIVDEIKSSAQVNVAMLMCGLIAGT